MQGNHRFSLSDLTALVFVLSDNILTTIKRNWTELYSYPVWPLHFRIRIRFWFLLWFIYLCVHRHFLLLSVLFFRWLFPILFIFLRAGRWRGAGVSRFFIISVILTRSSRWRTTDNQAANTILEQRQGQQQEHRQRHDHDTTTIRQRHDDDTTTRHDDDNNNDNVTTRQRQRQTTFTSNSTYVINNSSYFSR